MRVRSVLVLAVGIAAVFSPPAAAQKERTPGAANLPYWTLKGRSARQFVPGLDAALRLTAEQKQKLAAAWDETVRSEAVLAAGRTVKTDPNITDAQRQAALETISTANNQFRQSVETILTPEQKALIERINALFAEVQRDVAEQFQGDFATTKGNKEETERIRQEVRTRVETDFGRRIESLLTPEQREAMQTAATEERRAAEAAARAKAGK
jgi:Spy/CpxP family protein refolding chaperone